MGAVASVGATDGDGEGDGDASVVAAFFLADGDGEASAVVVFFLVAVVVDAALVEVDFLAVVDAVVEVAFVVAGVVSVVSCFEAQETKNATPKRTVIRERTDFFIDV
jgi:hypothetical protein